MRRRSSWRRVFGTRTTCEGGRIGALRAQTRSAFRRSFSWGVCSYASFAFIGIVSL